METTWLELFDYFGTGILAGMIAGVVCPLIGCFLLVRRTSLYGVALPQFAAAGVAFGFIALELWLKFFRFGDDATDMDLIEAMNEVMGDSHTAMNYHLSWALVFTFMSLFALVWLGRRGGSEVNRVAAGFALAMAATVMFAHASVFGEVYVHELLQGVILAIDVHQLETLGVLFGLILVAVVVFHRDLLLVSFDRESAQVMGKPVLRLELLLLVLVGMCVSIGAMTVGPMILFGLLVLPPMAARHWARSMQSLYVLAALFGLLAVLAGVLVSLAADLPTGPTVVVGAGVELLPGALFRPRGR